MLAGVNTSGMAAATSSMAVTKTKARQMISEQKADIIDKLERGETEEKIATGGNAYTQTEWQKMMKSIDETIDTIKEEQEEFKEKKEKDKEKQEAFVKELYQKMASVPAQEKVGASNIMDRLNGTVAPYSYLADENGIISYKGVTFVCDYENNRLCLGDVSQKEKVINVPLKHGGTLSFNTDNISDLTGAITMFCPEDINSILSAITTYEKTQKVQQEIADEVNSIGEKLAPDTDTVLE